MSVEMAYGHISKRIQKKQNYSAIQFDQRKIVTKILNG